MYVFEAFPLRQTHSFLNQDWVSSTTNAQKMTFKYATASFQRTPSKYCEFSLFIQTDKKKCTFKLILLTFRALSSVKIQSFADLFSLNKYGFEL